MSGVTEKPDDGAEFDDDITQLPANATCGICAFSVAIPLIDPETGQPFLDGRRQRVCKRFPPVPTAIPVAGPQGRGLTIVGYSAPVTDDDYCFEFIERSEPEVIPASLVIEPDGRPN